MQYIPSGSGLSFTGTTASVPGNKENNNTKKISHESATGSMHLPSATSYHHAGASSAGSAIMGLAKMSLKAREFGKEITNAASTTSNSQSNGLFSSTLHPQTAKHSDHSHHHPHPSNIIAVSVANSGIQKKPMSEQVRAGSSGIPEHLLVHHNTSGLAGPKIIMVLYYHSFN